MGYPEYDSQSALIGIPGRFSFSFYPFFERLASFATRWLFMPSVTLPKPCAGGGRLFRRT